MNFIKKIVKEDNFLSLSGNLIIAVFGFGGFALLARTLTPHEFGQWVIFISGGSLFQMVRNGITSNALVRFLSGAENEEKYHLVGSNVVINVIVTAVFVMILGLVYISNMESLSQSAYGIFFKWYPLVAFINLPINNALVVQQAKMQYGRILLIRSINSSFFFIFLILNFIIFNYGVSSIAIAFTLFKSITSIVCVAKSWDGLRFIRRAQKSTIRKLLNFGKFSTFTLIGTNLLKNADIFIISISPFGSAAVALFSIPLKLIEIQQIPLRSFAATAYPKMSKASIEGRLEKLKNLFDTYSGALTYFFFFISLGTFLLAEQFVILVSGYQYLDIEFHGIDIVIIVQIFSIYGLLLPIDRMTGIGLDSVNQPSKNAVKVMIMLVANIIGDLIAIYVFKSIELVAVSTLVFTTIGILVGIHYLNKSFKISLRSIVLGGNEFYRKVFLKIGLIKA